MGRGVAVAVGALVGEDVAVAVAVGKGVAVAVGALVGDGATTIGTAVAGTVG